MITLNDPHPYVVIMMLEDEQHRTISLFRAAANETLPDVVRRCCLEGAQKAGETLRALEKLATGTIEDVAYILLRPSEETGEDVYTLLSGLIPLADLDMPEEHALIVRDRVNNLYLSIQEIQD